MSVLRVCATLGLIWLATASWALGDHPKDPACTSCHDQGQKLQNSAHASLACTTCHARHEQVPHPAGIPKPACSKCHAKEAGEYERGVHGQAAKNGNAAAPDCEVCHGNVHELAKTFTWAFRKSIPDTCGGCHAEIAEQYHASIHGHALNLGVVDAPVCTTCHQSHLILSPRSPRSPVHSTQIRETCAQCHDNVRLSARYGLPLDRILSYDASYHGMAAKAGSETVANCASCHGIHLILPSTDPKSSINPNNLPKTCGQCHAGAGTRFALGPIHELPNAHEPFSVQLARAFYLFVIPLTIGLMFLHNIGDWARKVGQRRLQTSPQVAWVRASSPVADRSANEEIRMYGFERVQHALLLISFTTLVWTGFALKYPDGWWARPLLFWESSWPVRGMVHRIAAVVLMLVGAMHAISLTKSARLRRHWQTLWPRRGDVTEGIQNFAYNLGLRSRRPSISRQSYVEKIEYWAVVWGSVVMTITGITLWANTFVLRWLPKSFLDFATVVHFYEAVLAALAIAVWHLYSVIFDPDVYPMETAWLTGRSVKRREEPPPEDGPVPTLVEEKPETHGPPHP